MTSSRSAIATYWGHEMAASSSATQLGDLALTWSIDFGNADLSMIDSDLASDRGIETAVLLSLFLDRRADDDDVPPSGDPNDRRGWWADEFAENAGDLIGSRLWLLDRSVLSRETEFRAEEYVREALAWMIEDKVVAGIDITIERTKNALLIAIGLNRPGRDQVSFKFSRVWDSMQEAA